MYSLKNNNDFIKSIRKKELLKLLDEVILASEEAGYSQDESYTVRQNQIDTIAELLNELEIQTSDFGFKLILNIMLIFQFRVIYSLCFRGN